MDTVKIRRLHREVDPVGALTVLHDRLPNGQTIDVRTPIFPVRFVRPHRQRFSAASLEISLRRAGYKHITIRRRLFSLRATARS